MAMQLASLLLGLFVKARITVSLTWTTHMLSYTCCQGKNQLLMWNFTKGVSERIMELQWFFNETRLICLDSENIGFHVESLYDGRVVRNGTAGILMENVSSNDAGQYTLYVKLAEEKIRNIQHILLTVVDQVPHQCKPTIEIHSPNSMYCSTRSCERSQLSPEWIINGTQDPVSIGRYLPINEWTNYRTFCCLRGLKCHDDDQFKFCMPNPISSRDFTFKGDNHTRKHFEINTVQARNCQGNETGNITLHVVIILVAVMAVTVAFIVWRRQKSPFRTKVKSARSFQVCVKPKNSNTAMECTDDLQEVDIAAGTTAPFIKSDRSTNTDGSSSDPNLNQHVQIVNNISLDKDCFKYFVDSKRLLMTGCETVREDSTDTSETTSDFEDAVSVLQIQHNRSGSIDSYGS